MSIFSNIKKRLTQIKSFYKVSLKPAYMEIYTSFGEELTYQKNIVDKNSDDSLPHENFWPRSSKTSD